MLVKWTSVVKSLSDIKIYDPRERPRDKPRTIHFGADFNGFRVTTPTPTPTPPTFTTTITTTTTATPVYLHTTSTPGTHEEDIKGLPAPDVLLHAFGLLHNAAGSPTTPTSAPQPYDHWETSNTIISSSDNGQKHLSPLSAIKKLTSAHPAPPVAPLPPDASTFPPPISFSSLAPSYISSRRSVIDIHQTPMPVVHNSNPISYSTPSSNVYISKGDLPHHDPTPAYISSTPYPDHPHFSSSPYPKQQQHYEEAPVHTTPAPDLHYHNHEQPQVHASSTPRPDHPIFYSTPEPKNIHVESHADPHFPVHGPPLSQYLEVPKSESAFNHRHADHKHEFSPLPPPNTRITNLPDVLATLFHHQVQIQ
jgi:hypothetical protein